MVLDCGSIANPAVKWYQYFNSAKKNRPLLTDWKPLTTNAKTSQEMLQAHSLDHSGIYLFTNVEQSILFTHFVVG